MEQETVREGAHAAVALAGDLTAGAAGELRQLLRALVGDGVTSLRISLRQVRVLDSHGIGLLVAAHNSLRRAGGKLEVAEASAEHLELLRAMRLDRLFTIAGE